MSDFYNGLSRIARGIGHGAVGGLDWMVNNNLRGLLDPGENLTPEMTKAFRGQFLASLGQGIRSGNSADIFAENAGGRLAHLRQVAAQRKAEEAQRGMLDEMNGKYPTKPTEYDSFGNVIPLPEQTTSLPVMPGAARPLPASMVNQPVNFAPTQAAINAPVSTGFPQAAIPQRPEQPPAQSGGSTAALSAGFGEDPQVKSLMDKAGIYLKYGKVKEAGDLLAAADKMRNKNAGAPYSQMENGAPVLYQGQERGAPVRLGNAPGKFSQANLGTEMAPFNEMTGNFGKGAPIAPKYDMATPGNGQVVAMNPYNPKDTSLAYQGPPAAPTLTDAQKNYQFAVSNDHYKGTFQDFNRQQANLKDSNAEGTWSQMEVPDGNGGVRSVFFNNKTRAITDAPAGLNKPGTAAKADAAMTVASDAINFGQHYLASKDYSGPGDEALLEKYFELAKPSTGFRMTEAQMNMLIHARSWGQSTKAMLGHITGGTYFDDDQRQQIVKAMSDLGEAKAKQVGGQASISPPAQPGDVLYDMVNGKLVRRGGN